MVQTSVSKSVFKFTKMEQEIKIFLEKVRR
jgi:hypothetical protein